MAKAQATGEVRIIPTGMQKVAADINKSFARMGRAAAQAMKGAAIAGMAGATAGVLATLKNGFDQKVFAEQSEATMKSLLGGAEKASAAMKMLGEEAKENPMFRKKDMLMAGQALSNFADQDVGKLKALTETAQKLSLLNHTQGLEGAAYALKEALGGDYVSLASRFDIGKGEIKALRDAGLEGKKLVDQLLRMKGITDQSLVDRAGTMGAQLSAMRGQWDEMSEKIVAGFWPRIQETAQQFMGWLSQNQEMLIDVGTKLTEAMTVAFTWMTNFADVAIRTVQSVGTFLGTWWESFSSQFTPANFVGWITEMGKAGLAAAKGLVLQLVEMVLGVVKEHAPKLFKWAGGEGLLSKVGSAKDAAYAQASAARQSARGRDVMGTGAAMDAVADQWVAQDMDRANRRQQSATLRVDVTGQNLPGMMGAS